MGNVIEIYGAGISGLVAAIDLARSGRQVSVVEKGNNIGGSKDWHPSIQFSAFDIEATSEFVGVDLNSCFERVVFQRRYLYNRRIEIKPVNCYLCERGPRSSSVESFLYGVARSYGVEFYFGMDENLGTLKYRKNVIIATGLERQNYIDLEIPYADICGYKALLETNLDKTYVDFFNYFTNYDLAYLAALNGIAFILLFSRKGMNVQHLDAFREFLSRNEDIASNKWTYSEGCIPCEVNLTKNGLVLAGTISGMIDPFFANGIPGAFVSGKIAADYFEDRESAMRNFHNLTRSFRAKSLLKAIYDYVPFKQYLFPLFCAIEGRLKGVGFLPT